MQLLQTASHSSNFTIGLQSLRTRKAVLRRRTGDRPHFGCGTGRLLTETSLGHDSGYQYDAASNRTRLTWPDGQYVTWTFDAINRVDLVRQSGTATLADYDYHPLGQRAKLTRGNGAVTDFGFDTAQRLTALVHDLPGSADDQTYGFGYTPASQVSMQSASNAAYTWSAPAVSGRSYARNGLNPYTSVGRISVNHAA